MSIGEHKRTGKSNISDQRDPRYWPLYPEVSHQLCLIAGGDVPRGEERDIHIQPVDLAPTMAELAGARLNPPAPYQGSSFAEPLISGEGSHRDLCVTGCSIVSAQGVPRRASTPFVVMDKWGYVPVGPLGKAELFDLAEDPLAETDLSADNPDIVKDLHGEFLSYLDQHDSTEEFLALWKAPGGGDGSWAVDYKD
jgi:arylsulfatase A-like enzyme